jgi:hypothetical protein
MPVQYGRFSCGNYEMTFIRILIGIALLAFSFWMFTTKLKEIDDPWVGLPVFVVIAAIGGFGGWLIGLGPSFQP